jgi:hypothetical protein
MLSIILILIIVAIALYLFNAYVPLNARLKNFINGFICLLVLIWLLNLLFKFWPW